MDNIKMRDLLSLTHVPRWSIIPMIKGQSVAEHSFRVAIIALGLGEWIDLRGHGAIDFKALIRWALMHDGPECKTGDIPTPFKSRNREVLKLAEINICHWYESESLRVAKLEAKLVKIADTMEAVMFIRSYGVKPHIDGLEDEMINRINREVKEAELEILLDYINDILEL